MCVGVLLAATGCAAVKRSVEPLAVVRVATDRDDYDLRRVAILPIRSNDMRLDEERALQGALALQLGEHLDAEFVLLSRGDAEEIPDNDSFRRGRIEPQAVIGLAQRFNLDALLVVNVSERRTYAPQRLGLEVELTACDTGLPIWNASLRLDAAQARTLDNLRTWFDNEREAHDVNESVDLYLLSPQRFAEFAAAQLGLAY